MSLKVFDYKCPVCGEIKEITHKAWETNFVHRCPEQDNDLVILKRLPAGTRTHFRFADQKLKR